MASKTTLFRDVAAELIKDAERRVADGENSSTLVRDYKQRNRLYCEPHLGHLRCSKIDAKRLREFRQELSGRVKPATALTIMSFVSKVLNLAEDDGVIDRKPRVPRGGHKDCPRPAFTRAEYGKLKQTLKKVESGKPRIDFKGSVVDKELRLLVTFMVNSFFRPGDIFVLQHKHITVVERPGEDSYPVQGFADLSRHLDFVQPPLGCEGDHVAIRAASN